MSPKPQVMPTYKDFIFLYHSALKHETKAGVLVPTILHESEFNLKN